MSDKPIAWAGASFKDLEPLIYSHMAATAAWRDEMQGVARSQGLFSLTRDTTRQFARQAPSHGLRPNRALASLHGLAS